MLKVLTTVPLNRQEIAVLLIVMLIGMGIFSVSTIPTDSFPDVSNTQVQIIVEPENMATEEIESLVTVPIEYALNGLPFIEQIRSSSEDSLAVITAIFEDQCDVYLARQLVQQRLNTLSFPPEVPPPQLGPVISSFSQVFMYLVEGEGYNMTELRTLQDWTIAKLLLSTPGVGNVVTYGGFVKQYQIHLNQFALRSYGLSVTDVIKAAGNSNINSGGSFIEAGDEEIVIRSLGRVSSLADIENIVLKEIHGTPVMIKNIGKVTTGRAFRRGSASKDGKGEAVVGIVMTRKGANTKEVVKKLEAKLESIRKVLPRGVKIKPFYNQKELVDKTTDTVKEILIFSGGLVIIILAAVLMNIPVALIVCTIIPLSLLFSFILMKLTGLSANLMTLGAVEFGVVVDAGVVMAENIFRKLNLAKAKAKNGEITNAERLTIIEYAALEVGRPITFAILIIMSVYVPLFALESVEGKMFQPLALTFIYALLGALLVSLTIIPVLCYWFLKGNTREKKNPALDFIRLHYLKLLKRILEAPKKATVTTVILVTSTMFVVPFIGSEFIPSLDEGSIWLRLRMPPSISHTRTSEIAGKVENMLREFPETSIAVTRVGRSGMGSDNEGVDAADMFIGLKPKSKWQIKNKEELVARMAEKVGSVPGLMYGFSQPIADMIDDLITGVKADVGIKIFGENLEILDGLANSVSASVKQVKGTADVSREPILGSPQLRIHLNRKELARHGLVIGDVQDIIQAALAGKVVSEVFEGNRRFGILVRLDPKHRKTVENIGSLVLDAPDGVSLKLKSVARIELARGALEINRDNGVRRAAVMVNIRGRDLGSWVAAAKEQVNKDVRLPGGYEIVWGGQFENQQRAMKRLSIVVPIILFIIFLLLYFTTNSLKNATVVMLTVPMAISGGLIALFITGQPMSVPAIIGFIALFGVVVQNGVILVTYILQLEREGFSPAYAVKKGAMVRFRPVLMTALTALMGLLPKLFSDGTGAEIQRPLATVVFGGLLTATIMSLIILPAIYLMANRNKATYREYID